VEIKNPLLGLVGDRRGLQIPPEGLHRRDAVKELRCAVPSGDPLCEELGDLRRQGLVRLFPVSWLRKRFKSGPHYQTLMDRPGCRRRRSEHLGQLLVLPLPGDEAVGGSGHRDGQRHSQEDARQEAHEQQADVHEPDT